METGVQSLFTTSGLEPYNLALTSFSFERLLPLPGADFFSVSAPALLCLPPSPPSIPHCGVWCLAVAWSSQQPHSHTALDCDLVDHIYVFIPATYKRQCLGGYWKDGVRDRRSVSPHHTSAHFPTALRPGQEHLLQHSQG